MYMLYEVVCSQELAIRCKSAFKPLIFNAKRRDESKKVMKMYKWYREEHTEKYKSTLSNNHAFCWWRLCHNSVVQLRAIWEKNTSDRKSTKKEGKIVKFSDDKAYLSSIPTCIFPRTILYQSAHFFSPQFAFYHIFHSCCCIFHNNWPNPCTQGIQAHQWLGISQPWTLLQPLPTLPTQSMRTRIAPHQYTIL